MTNKCEPLPWSQFDIDVIFSNKMPTLEPVSSKNVLVKKRKIKKTKKLKSWTAPLKLQMRKFIHSGDIQGLIDETRTFFQDLKTAHSPKVLANDSCETMKIYFDDIRSEFSRFDLERWANLLFLKLYIEFVEDDMLDLDLDPNYIYQTDAWKEFNQDRIEYFYKNSEFLQILEKKTLMTFFKGHPVP